MGTLKSSYAMTKEAKAFTTETLAAQRRKLKLLVS